MENEIQNISLKELTQIESLSVRSQNVCELNDLMDIIPFYFTIELNVIF